jgi:DNA-repair protein complementing XP-A cells
MVNSKGGFLVGEDKEADAELREKEKKREKERAQQNTEPGTSIVRNHFLPVITYAWVIAVHFEPGKNPKCHECGSIDIDHTFRKVFRCLVCNKCKNEKPDKYSLLTKTECKEVYNFCLVSFMYY